MTMTGKGMPPASFSIDQPWETRVQTVFGDSEASSFLYVAFDYGVCPSSSEEGSGEVSAAWSYVEKTGLQGRREAETWVEHIPDWGEERVHVPHQRAACDRDDEEVWVTEEDYDASWIYPCPEFLGVFFSWEGFEFVGAFAMDCFGEEGDDENAAQTCEGALEPEDVAPGDEGDDYAADEWTKCWADKSPTHEPAVGCPSLYGSVDVTDGRAADDEKGSALESCQTAENEVACKVVR
ncbi:hypothetical protein AC578_10975 [Pseudocercospora eumusae]|uniref:Uncharacterized protein n=1 Tax=Pseudocercospora eumusae TaxID=321146 RepID=A0A139HSP0_9PEZI|nr:hypothetical protein AC578_10975 [Pseudocercospora eumusae]